MIAYDRTMAMGADFVDVDLRLSQDDVVVNFHDETVDRMTGTSGEVDKMTFSQLSKLDAGATFTPPGTPATAPAAELHPFSGIGVTIPSFESVLQRFPHTFISIDLKDETADVIQRVCALLVRYGRLGDVFVGSNSDDQIVQFRKQCPTVRTSATLADVRADNQARTTNAPNFVSAITVDQPPFRANGRQLVDAASVAWSHQHGIAIMPWVVNDESDMQYLISIGVDAIYTSYPDRLLRLLGRCTAQC